MDKNYTVTHLHTMYSNGTTNIDSVTKYEDYILRAKELGMKAIAFTEHGNMFNHIKKRDFCEKNDIKYIHGIETYITETLNTKIRDNYHVCLYAKNYEGYLELNKLASASGAYNRKSNNYYYIPRMSMETLMNTSSNILVTSSCLGGVLNNGSDEIREQFLNFMKENNDRCFLEIQHHKVKQQIEYNKKLYEYSKEYNIRLITGTDTHALNDKHIKGRHILQLSKDITFDNEEGWDLTFKSYEELVEAYINQNSLPMDVILEAIENTNVLSSMVEEYKIDRLPKYPQLYNNPEQIFKEKINKGVVRRGINKKPDYKEKYLPRILEEFEVYKKVNSINYMLLQDKITSTAIGEGGAEFGYGRGSVNGSLIAYILGITETDPIKYNLNFYRFMNPDRVTMPDIDGDHSDKDREWVKNFIFNMEGVYTSEIITFNTIALKGAIKDVARALNKGIKKGEEGWIDADKISNEIEEKEDYYRNLYPELFEYVDIVQGTIVSIGSHPAAVIVSPIPLDDNIGTCMLNGNDRPVSMIDMKSVDALGLVKLDILGLDTISIINETCQMAGIPRITPDTVVLDDKKVWDSIKEDTTGIFQMESDMAKKYLNEILSDKSFKKIKSKYPNITNFDLYMFVNAAIRPAGENFRNEACQGVCNETGIKHLDDMLYDTLGYVLLQEQIMQFLVDFCGYSNAESDSIRRAIGKKEGTEDFLEEIKLRFLEYTPKKYNIEIDKAMKIIDPFIETVKSASNYGFSKNHNVPYAITGIVAGYLRYYYPLEFICSSLNIWTRKKKPDDITRTTEYAYRNNVTIKEPRFRYSKAEYFIDKETNSIFKGVESIKYLNKEVGEYLYSLRDKQYNSFIELLEDIKGIVNSRQLNILIELDYFEEFGKSQKLKDIVELYNNVYTKKQFKKDSLPFDIDVIRQYAENETEKTFTKVDTVGLCRYIESTLTDEYLPIQQRVKSWIENTGSCTLTDQTQSKKNAIVIDINTKYKTPKVKLYNLYSGKTAEVKIGAKNWREDILELFDMITIIKTTPKNKRKKMGDDWVEVDEKEYWLENYTKI